MMELNVYPDKKDKVFPTLLPLCSVDADTGLQMVHSLGVFARAGEDLDTDNTLLELVRKVLLLCPRLHHLYVEFIPAYTFLSIEYANKKPRNYVPESKGFMIMSPGQTMHSDSDKNVIIFQNATPKRELLHPISSCFPGAKFMTMKLR